MERFIIGRDRIEIFQSLEMFAAQISKDWKFSARAASPGDFSLESPARWPTTSRQFLEQHG
jgi:hypothetical protein